MQRSSGCSSPGTPGSSFRSSERFRRRIRSASQKEKREKEEAARQAATKLAVEVNFCPYLFEKCHVMGLIEIAVSTFNKFPCPVEDTVKCSIRVNFPPVYQSRWCAWGSSKLQAIVLLYTYFNSLTHSNTE